MARTHRKRNEDALVLALACGATVEAAARQCGVHPRTAYRRMKDPAFATELARVPGEVVARTTGMLTAASTEAVRTLLELLKGTAPAAVRLGAARAVLEVGLKLRVATDLEREVDELTARLDAQEAEDKKRTWPGWAAQAGGAS